MRYFDVCVQSFFALFVSKKRNANDRKPISKPMALRVLPGFWYIRFILHRIATFLLCKTDERCIYHDRILRFIYLLIRCRNAKNESNVQICHRSPIATGSSANMRD